MNKQTEENAKVTTKQMTAAFEKLPRLADDANPIPKDEYLTIKETCSMLKCSRVFLWERTKDGTLPKPIKLGRKVLYSRDDLENYLRKEAAHV